MTQFKVVVERHEDGYVAYPLGLNGVIVGQGDSSQAALADVKSAILFHIESFGQDILDAQAPVLEAYVTDADIQV
jgi:predicted RNase H-like HicB family nuclease